MQVGETVLLTAGAKVGSLSETAAKTAVASVVAGALSGGAFMVGFSQREAYIVLTDRQLLLFEADVHTGGPGKHLVSLPRELVTVAELKVGVLFVKMQLNIQAWGQGLKLTFPPIPPSTRRRGVELANALPRTVG
jgi:hypothetical protein